MKAWTEDWQCPQCGAKDGSPKWRSECMGGYPHLFAHCGRCGYSEQVGPAAKAALDELIEAEPGEWVYVGAHCVHRVSSDGSVTQYLGGNGWTRDADDWRALYYRKGREAALEQVKELVEAVEDQQDKVSHGTPMNWAEWYPIVELARALKATDGR